MAYCRKCGEIIDDEAVFCPKCGVQQTAVKTDSSDDDGSVLWLVLAFLIPIAGVFMWLLWKDDKPESAKMAGIGTIAALIIWFIVLLPFILLFSGVLWH